MRSMGHPDYRYTPMILGWGNGPKYQEWMRKAERKEREVKPRETCPHCGQEMP